MLIVCKTCASTYHIPREILGESGCRLRCVGCGEAWAVTPGPIGIDNGPVVEGERAPMPTLAPPRSGAGHRAAAFGVQGRAASLTEKAARKARTAVFRIRRTGQRAGVIFVAALVIGGAYAVVAGRVSIVKAVPNSARIFAAVGWPVNLRGLALDNVRTNIFDLGDKKVLVVEGAVRNLRDGETEAPNMRIALRGADKRELYVWTAPAPKSTLGPNEQVTFRTRLAAPPEGVNDVLVRFAAVGDRLSPMKDGL